MKKLLILFILIPFMSFGQGKRELANSYLEMINSDTLVDLFFTYMEGEYLALGPKTFESYGLDYTNSLDQHEFDSLIHKNFIFYKKEIRNSIYSHYSNLEDSQLQEYISLGKQGEDLEDLRKKSGYFELLEKEFKQMQASYNHDLKFVIEAVLANQLPLKLVLFINNDSISSITNEDLKIYMVFSGSVKTEILNPENLEIMIPKDLDYSSIKYLTIEYNGNSYDFFKPLFDVSNSSIDPNILANVNSVTNNLVRDTFENKLYWYVTIDKNEISFKLKSRQIKKIKN